MTSPIRPDSGQLMTEGPLDPMTLNTLCIMAYAVKCHIHDAPPCMHCFKRLLELGAHALPLLDRIRELEQVAHAPENPLSGLGNSGVRLAEPRYDLIAEAGFWIAPEVCI